MTQSVLQRLAPTFLQNFKQPSFYILAAQCVRGLPVPREPREAMERWEAPGCLRGTLGGGGEPTSRGKATARAQGKAQRLPALHQPPGYRPFRDAPVRPALALSAERNASRKRRPSNMTRSG